MYPWEPFIVLESDEETEQIFPNSFFMRDKTQSLPSDTNLQPGTILQQTSRWKFYDCAKMFEIKHH